VPGLGGSRRPCCIGVEGRSDFDGLPSKKAYFRDNSTPSICGWGGGDLIYASCRLSLPQVKTSRAAGPPVARCIHTAPLTSQGEMAPPILLSPNACLAWLGRVLCSKHREAGLWWRADICKHWQEGIQETQHPGPIGQLCRISSNFIAWRHNGMPVLWLGYYC